MGCFELLHKIKRKSGEDPKDDDPSRLLISHMDQSVKHDELPIKSVISMRSKGTLNLGEDVEELLRENGELRSSINEMSK